jgi:hypothetical protein
VAITRSDFTQGWACGHPIRCPQRVGRRLSSAASFGRHRAGLPSLTRWGTLPRSASLDPIIDFFHAGGDSGLPRPEPGFADHIPTGSHIDDPVPPRRRAFLNFKFCAAMSHRPLLLFPVNQRPCAGAPLPTTIPSFRFRRADKMRPAGLWPAAESPEGLVGYQGVRDFPGRLSEAASG